MTTPAALPAADALALLLHGALPQTQCTRCGFPDCASYAQAIADGEADINRCPPGGAEGIARLSALTGRPALGLDPVNGVEGVRAVAVIDEAWCIGCTLCIDACPTDAIVGSSKTMHSVVEAYCTGCELCLPVCPVDCINLEAVSGARTGWAAWSAAQAAEALERYQFSRWRHERDAGSSQTFHEGVDQAAPAVMPAPGDGTGDVGDDRKRAVIDMALARARALRAPPG